MKKLHATCDRCPGWITRTQFFNMNNQPRTLLRNKNTSFQCLVVYGDEDRILRWIAGALQRDRLDSLCTTFQALSVKANKVADDDKLHLLLALVRAPTYKLLVSLSAPKDPGELTYKEVVDKIAAHFKLKPSIIAEWFRFYKMAQQNRENMTDYQRNYVYLLLLVTSKNFSWCQSTPTSSFGWAVCYA